MVFDGPAALSETRSLADDRPFINEVIVLSKLEYIELKAQRNSSSSGMWSGDR